MSAKQVDLRISAAGGHGSGTATVDGIPADLWARFVERATETMPEKGADAWASVLSEVVASMGGGGSTHTLIMTDIPNSAADALDAIAAEVDESPDGLIAQLYRYADAGALHLVRMHDDLKQQPSHLVVLYGVPQRHWDAWAKLAAMVDETPESLFGLLVQLAEQGKVKANKEVDGTTPPNGDRPRSGRAKQRAAADA